MPGERPLGFPRLGIPQLHRPVPTPTGKRPTIRAEHYLRIPGEGLLQFPRLSIP